VLRIINSVPYFRIFLSWISIYFLIALLYIGRPITTKIMASINSFSERSVSTVARVRLRRVAPPQQTLKSGVFGPDFSHGPTQNHDQINTTRLEIHTHQRKKMASRTALSEIRINKKRPAEGAPATKAPAKKSKPVLQVPDYSSATPPAFYRDIVLPDEDEV
jgi:hypothetical protein